MASWARFEAAAPELAAAVRARFAAHRHALLATLRRDGAPRISGIETTFRDGELWLAMMPDSRKAADLRRDGRFALHAAPVDLALVDGDAKLGGRAIEVTDPDTIGRFVGSSSNRRRRAVSACSAPTSPTRHSPASMATAS